MSERVDFASHNSQWFLCLLILAKAHESNFHQSNDKWIIELSFQEFLVQHKAPLIKLIEALLKDLKGKELELIRPNREREYFWHRPFFSSVDNRFYEVSLNDIEDLGHLFKEVFISKIRFSFPKLQRFSSTSDALQERIKKSSATITHETARCIYELTHNHVLDLKVLAEAPQGTLQALIQATEILGLDLILKGFKDIISGLGYVEITEKNKVACEEILNWAKPEKLFIDLLAWLDLVKPEVTKSLHLSVKIFNQIVDKEPCTGITHLHLHAFGGEKWSPNTEIFRKVFPNVANVAFQCNVQFDSSFLKSVKNIVIEGYPWGNLYNKDAIIGLEHLSSIRKLVLNRGWSTFRVQEEDDFGPQVFDQLAKLPKLSTLYIYLPKDVKPEAFALFKESKLKKLYVDRDEEKIQAIVGRYIQVKKGRYSAFNEFYSLKKIQ